MKFRSMIPARVSKTTPSTQLRRSFAPVSEKAARLLLVSLAMLAPFQSLRASVAGEVVERLAKFSGRFVDDAGKAAAREALEKAAAKYGDEVIEVAERGGFGLAEAGAKYGDDAWRLAKLAPGAPKAVAARADTLVPLARRFGDDAALLEIKAPGCGEILATTLKPETLRQISTRAGKREVKRFTALAKHCSPQEVEAAVKAWQKGGSKVLEHLTAKRIAALGFAGALVYGGHEISETAKKIDPNFPIPLPRTLPQSIALILALVALVIFRKPLWLALRLAARFCVLLWRGLRQALRFIWPPRANATPVRAEAAPEIPNK